MLALHVCTYNVYYVCVYVTAAIRYHVIRMHAFYIVWQSFAVVGANADEMRADVDTSQVHPDTKIA